MGEAAESILGTIEVTTRLNSGIEQLTVFLTPKRLILAYIGKRGLGELPGMSMLGKWGAGIEGLFKGPGESRRKRKMEQGAKDLSPEEILKAGKDNFEISYEDVVRVEIDDIAGVVAVMILTKDDKYEFFTHKDFVAVSHLLQRTLGEKVESRRA